MDSDRTSNNCFWTMGVDDTASKDARTSLIWTREEDRAFEIALTTHYNDADMWGKIALAVPGKTVQDLKLHYEALRVMAVESGKMPLSIYPNKGDVLEEKKLKSEQVQRGAHWTEEEHSQFLHGLKMYGKGEWTNISKHSVRTRSRSQVASHAQKYYRGLSSTKTKGKQFSIIDITTLKPEKSLALKKETTSSMPECCKGESSTADGYPNQLAPPAGSLPITGHPTPSNGIVGNCTGAPGQDFDLFFDGRYDIGASTEILDDLDLSLFPNFMD